jgi:Tfp pilus assembly protein PilZ
VQLRLKLRVVAKEDWAKYYDAAGGTVFCPSATPPSVGQSLQLEVLFQGGPRLLVRGVVLWRRPAGDARARAGVGLGIHPVDRDKLEFINHFVRDQMGDQRRRRRLPLRLRATYTARTGRRINFTRDIHEEGVFVRSSELLTSGDDIKLLLVPPGGNFKPIEVRGRVVRLVEEQPHRGMGINLVFKDPEEQRGFAEFVKRLEEEYLAGTLPDEALSKHKRFNRRQETGNGQRVSGIRKSELPVACRPSPVSCFSIELT